MRSEMKPAAWCVRMDSHCDCLISDSDLPPIIADQTELNQF